MNRLLTKRWTIPAVALLLVATVMWAALPHAASSPDADELRRASEACVHGDAEGCEDARVVFLAGDDAARAHAPLAVEFLARSCEEGRLPACAAVATAYLEGFGVKPEPERALALAERACAGGVGWGCDVAGAVLLARRGPDDLDRAREAFAQGCLSGDAASCNDLRTPDLAGAKPIRRLSVLVEHVRTQQPLRAFEVIRADRQTLRILRNTVFAAHGHRFQSGDLRAFFTGHGWYAPRTAAVDEAALDDVDRRNLALLKAAEARGDAPLSPDDADGSFLSAILEAPHEGAPLSEEERALAGEWVFGGGPPAEDIPVLNEAYVLYPDRIVFRGVHDCREPFVHGLGFWRVSGGNLWIRWFAEYRWTRGSMEEEGQRCSGWQGVPPTWSSMEREDVFPITRQETVDGPSFRLFGAGFRHHAWNVGGGPSESPLQHPGSLEVERQ